jgi:hypothetical protein
MTVKKYDLDFGETGSSSIEGGYYPVQQNGVGNQPVSHPSSGFNRANPNSYQTVLQRSALMDAGVMGTVSAGLGAVGIVLRAYQDIQNNITDINYGDFHRELVNSVGTQPSDINSDGICPVNEGEIIGFNWELNFDSEGYAHIEFQTGESIGERAEATYPYESNLVTKVYSLKTYNEIKSEAERRVREYNETKDFYGGASESRQRERSFDYHDVPVMNGGGGGSDGPSKFRQIPTAIV